MKEQYIGRNRVMGVSDAGFKTPLGNEVIEVLYTSGQKETMSRKTFDLVVTEEPIEKDAEETVMRKKFADMLRDIQIVVAEYDLSGNELHPFVTQLTFNLEDVLYRAANWLWTKNDMKHIPGAASPFGNKTLLEAHRIVMEIPENETREHQQKSSKESGANS